MKKVLYLEAYGSFMNSLFCGLDVLMYRKNRVGCKGFIDVHIILFNLEVEWEALVVSKNTCMGESFQDKS